jgi:hypothetical protein
MSVPLRRLTPWQGWQSSTFARVRSRLLSSEYGLPPEPSSLEGVPKQVWDELGVIAQAESIGAQSANSPTHEPPYEEGLEEERVRWRIAPCA